MRLHKGTVSLSLIIRPFLVMQPCIMQERDLRLFPTAWGSGEALTIIMTPWNSLPGDPRLCC